MFASNFIIPKKGLEYVRGEDKISKYLKTEGITTGNTMENHFCSICGSLMFRVSSGYPNHLIMRIGQVDDTVKQETTLKPRIEQFTNNRIAWLEPGKDTKQHGEGYYVQKAKI